MRWVQDLVAYLDVIDELVVAGATDADGMVLCRMFQRVIRGQFLPKYLAPTMILCIDSISGKPISAYSR